MAPRHGFPAASQRRFPLDTPEDELIAQQVEDAQAATPAQRMAAAISLLDAVYRLWQTRGLADDRGLCRFPGCVQERRPGLLRLPQPRSA